MEKQEEFKMCPHCAEKIKLNAKKCRYCGERLDNTIQIGSPSINNTPTYTTNQLYKDINKKRISSGSVSDIIWAFTIISFVLFSTISTYNANNLIITFGILICSSLIMVAVGDTNIHSLLKSLFTWTGFFCGYSS